MSLRSVVVVRDVLRRRGESGDRYTTPAKSWWWRSGINKPENGCTGKDELRQESRERLLRVLRAADCTLVLSSTPADSMAPEALHTPMLPAQLTPVLPLQDPPTAAETRPPSLPPISVTSETDKHWTVTRHVFAAAYPRSRVGSYVDAKAGGELRSALDPGMRLSGPEIENKVAAMKDNQRGASLQGEKDAGHLWLAVNCYRPKRRQSTGVPKEKPGVTLILAHATGLHKEVCCQRPMRIRNPMIRLVV